MHKNKTALEMASLIWLILVVNTANTETIIERYNKRSYWFLHRNVSQFLFYQKISKQIFFKKRSSFQSKKYQVILLKWILHNI